MTGKRTSLRTQSEEDALQVVNAKNQAERQPALNLQIAKAYLAGTDNGLTTPTWSHALKAITESRNGPTRERWERVSTDKALSALWDLVIIETRAERLLQTMQTGTVSTNVYLRRIHNFCVDMNWLPWPLIPKRQWPAVRFKEKRAITWEEHCRILEREKNPERRAFYELAWHIGAGFAPTNTRATLDAGKGRPGRGPPIAALEPSPPDSVWRGVPQQLPEHS